MNPARTLSIGLLRIVLAGTSGFVGAAAATPAEDAERAKLVQEHAAIASTYSARLAECQLRFVVTSCVEDAKRDRRQGLDALRARQLVLDEQRRKERSSARRAELSANTAEQAKRDAARADRPADAASQAATGHDAPGRSLEAHRSSLERPSTAKRPIAQGGGASAAKGAAAPDRAAKEARSRATFEARQQQAAEHRDEVEEKAAKREKQRPPAAPLPIPTDIQPAR